MKMRPIPLEYYMQILFDVELQLLMCKQINAVYDSERLTYYPICGWMRNNAAFIFIRFERVNPVRKVCISQTTNENTHTQTELRSHAKRKVENESPVELWLSTR